MFEHLKAVWHQSLETVAQDGWAGLVRQKVFWRRKATPVEMDLTSVSSSPAEILRGFDCELVELNMDDLHAGKWNFLVVSRGIQAARFIKHGWRGFAFHQNGRVIGDVWCVTPRGDGSPITHPDLNLLGIVCGNRDAYAFDAYIAPEFRGRNLAAPLQRCLHAILKTEGHQKVYGYYMDDNLPALWMHRLLRFKELPKRMISRFLWFRKSEIVGNSTLSNKSTPTLPRRWSERDKNP